MVGYTANIFNRYCADPTERDYKLMADMFLSGTQTPQEVMGHGAEWVGPSARVEFMTIVENCPNMVQAWYDACCAAFSAERPIHMNWRTDLTIWAPNDGAPDLDNRSRVDVDDSGHKVRLTLTTPIPNVRLLGAFTA